MELTDKKLQLLNISLSICSFQFCTFMFEIWTRHPVFQSPACLRTSEKFGGRGGWLLSAGQWNVNRSTGDHFRSGPSRAPPHAPACLPPLPTGLAGR